VSNRWPAQGGLETCIGDAGRGGLRGVLAGLGHGDGALWVGGGETTPVGNVQRAEGKKGGSGGCSSSFPPCLTAWVGAGEAGLDSGGLHEHGYRAGANVNSDGHSRIDFLDFCPPGARHNARKNSKFEFLKSFTLGCQHIKQGFQNYFCSKEISCFAKI
jgi:hypothetical protein